MSAREKRRKREAPMPAASAGLLRFFEEETPGIKVRPEVVLMLSIGLIAISLFAYLTFKQKPTHGPRNPRYFFVTREEAGQL